MSRLVVGIAGGTGSGKTTVAQNIASRLELDSISVFQQDAYYRDLKELVASHRNARNFDHPDALEQDLFVEHLKALKAGRSIEQPVYDFTTHTRTAETVTIESREVVIAEGILLFYDLEVRDLLEIKIFVDTPADIRLLRRIRRDINDRGRSLDTVTDQYIRTVRPMHEEFVEPTKRFADVIVPEGGRNEIAIDMIASRIRLMQQISL